MRFNLCRRYFLFHALNVSLCYQQQCNFMMSQYLILQDTCVRGHSHIESFHSLRENDTKFETHPTSILYVKMPNLLKIIVHNFTYKICVGILMRLFFLSYKCINKCIYYCINKYITYLQELIHFEKFWKIENNYQVEVLRTSFLWFLTHQQTIFSLYSVAAWGGVCKKFCKSKKLYNFNRQFQFIYQEALGEKRFFI